MSNGAVKRKVEWSQENPRDQLRVLLGAMAGELSNIKGGIINERQLPRIDGYLNQCIEIAAKLAPGRFE